MAHHRCVCVFVVWETPKLPRLLFEYKTLFSVISTALFPPAWIFTRRRRQASVKTEMYNVHLRTRSPFEYNGTMLVPLQTRELVSKHVQQVSYCFAISYASRIRNETIFIFVCANNMKAIRIETHKRALAFCFGVVFPGLRMFCTKWIVLQKVC